MTLHPFAGKPAPKVFQIENPDSNITRASLASETAVSGSVFGTSSHRGSSLRGSFNETHVLAITHKQSAITEETGALPTETPIFVGDGIKLYTGEERISSRM